MEILDDGDLKRDLMKKSEHHRQELKGDFRLITENTEKIVTNALVIGGSLALTYFLVTRLTGSDRKKRKKGKQKVLYVQPEAAQEQVVVHEPVPSEPGIVQQLTTAIASQASVFLLNLAKEKLTEFIQVMAEKKTDEK